MSAKFLAQDGHGPATKIVNGIIAGDISGTVLSLKSRSPDNLIGCIETLQEEHSEAFLILDHHMHASVYPETTKHGKLPDYGLFEMNKTAFELESDESIQDATNAVMDLQINLGLNNLTSPSLGMQEFNDTNAQVSLKLYRQSIKYLKDNSLQGAKKLFLTLVFSEQALNQKHSLAQMLDKLTLLDADGFYIIVERQKRDSAVWSNSDTLAGLMYLVNILHNNEYEVVVGYTDVYGLLLSAVGADYVGSGWYQTLRQYSQNFYREGFGSRGTPLYVSETLLSPIFTNPDLRSIVTSGFGDRVIDSHYGQALITNPALAPWNEEAYALQLWRTLSRVADGLGDDTVHNLEYIEGLLDEADSLFTELEGASVTIDDRHDDKHLAVWKSAIQKFRIGVL